MILIVISISVLVAWKSLGNNQDRVQLLNETSAISIVSLRQVNQVKDRTTFQLIVRNVSPKPIISVNLRQEDKNTSKNTIETSGVGGFTTNWRLLPNATVNMYFTAASEGNIRLTIAAVMYEDGITEGDSFVVEELKKERAGVKFAFQRFLPILQMAKQLQTNDIPDGMIQSMINEIESINRQRIPQVLWKGFTDAKNDVVSNLKDFLQVKEKQRGNPQFKANDDFQKRLERIEMVLVKLGL
jgi:hypothetical protein